MKNREWRIEDRGWQARINVGQASRLPGERFSASRFPFKRFFADGFAIGWAGGTPALLWRRLVVALFCFCLVPFTFCLRASGQSYSIDWHKIAGGGGTSTNAQYNVSGTIGQHDAGGPMTGGNYSLTGGFWALISVMQTPGAPTLYISHAGNTVTVYWQAVAGWTNLEQNSSLSVPAGWTTNTAWTSVNGTNSLSLTAPAGNLFFRLAQ